MVGKISVVPYGERISGITDLFGSPYSHYRVRIESLVWYIAISPAVKSIASLKPIKGSKNVQVLLVCDANGHIETEEEVLCLGYEARKLCSKSVVDLVKSVDRWELGV